MIRVHIEKIGGIRESIKRVGGRISFAAEQIGGGICTVTERHGGIEARAYREGGILCRMYREVKSSLNAPYLEISPTIVWVLAGWTSNDVFSNTTWNVE